MRLRRAVYETSAPLGVAVTRYSPRYHQSPCMTAVRASGCTANLVWLPLGAIVRASWPKISGGCGDLVFCAHTCG